MDKHDKSFIFGMLAVIILLLMSTLDYNTSVKVSVQEYTNNYEDSIFNSIPYDVKERVYKNIGYYAPKHYVVKEYLKYQKYYNNE